MEHSQMAKRMRATARRNPKYNTAPKAYKNAREAQPTQSAIRNGPPKWRPPGIAIEYTPELLENARQRFEETDESSVSIAADMGIHARTLYRLALRENWKRRKQPHDLSPAAKLLMQAESLSGPEPLQSAEQAGPVRADTDQQGPDGAALIPSVESTLPPLPPHEETIERLHRAVLKELSAVETMRAALGREPQSPIDAERTARTLASLTATLQNLRRMQCAMPKTGPYDDDIPADIGEFRKELARRIEAFVASRTDHGDDDVSAA